MASNKEIKALSDYEHVRLRPTMYVGQIAKTDMYIPTIEKDKDANEFYIAKKDEIISPAFYKLFDEVLSNAFDEAIRLNGKMKSITISFDSKTNEVVVKDTGGGFYKGTEINEKTGKTNIETAFSYLKAGSNFDDSRADMVIGTNGVGVSLVNMLSEYFEVETINDEYLYKQRWTKENWETNTFNEPEIVEKKKSWKTGTTIRFKPCSKLFKGSKWDKDYIHTLLVLKNFALKHDPILSKVDFKAFFNGKELNLGINIIPKDASVVNTKVGKVWVFSKKQNGMSLSFINNQLCTGTHQRIINEKLNSIFSYQYAHYFYDTIILLNLLPKYVRFADQNKTKFATGKAEIEPLLAPFGSKLKVAIKDNEELSNTIAERIRLQEKANSVKDFNKAKKKMLEKSSKFSSKYYPASSKKNILFIAEGLSASGGLIQARNTKNVGVYALKGKIKNVRTVADLSESSEIVQLTNILGLDLNKESCSYNKIVIATDADMDGNHICGLLINFFYKWFPWIIERGNLYVLKTPIITAVIDGKLTHFYDKEDFYGKSFKSVKDKSYIKGLGSLSEDDWKLIFEEMVLERVVLDKNTKKYLNIAFGSDASLRKKWLENKL